jgi:hypothetical protein
VVGDAHYLRASGRLAALLADVAALATQLLKTHLRALAACSQADAAWGDDEVGAARRARVLTVEHSRARV